MAEEPPIRLFLMGVNRWRNEYEWPLAWTRSTPYYFHSRGKANSLDGDVTLIPEQPQAEPMPTGGGNTLILQVIPT